MHWSPCCVCIGVFTSSVAVAASSPAESRHCRTGGWRATGNQECAQHQQAARWEGKSSWPPRAEKTACYFFAFSFWCQGKGPGAGPAPRYRRSRLLASPIVFSSGSRGFQLPVMGLCPARRESPPKEQPSCILIDGKDLQIRLAWPTALLFLSPISLIQ